MKDEDKMIDIETLQEMARKIEGIPRRQDFHKYPPPLSEEEKVITDALRPIVQYVMYDEIYRLNRKINNHHHVTLSVKQGMEYRDNGMAIGDTVVTDDSSDDSQK